MKKVNRRKAGFTLVELMVVAIIVAILAAVAIPLMSGNKARAMQSEGDAGIGTVVTALRVYRAEHSGYPTETEAQASTLSGISSTDLDGQFFDTVDFTYTSTISNYTVTCTGGENSGRGLDEGKTSGFITTLDDQGTWDRAGY